jgi:hypothetical protein
VRTIRIRRKIPIISLVFVRFRLFRMPVLHRSATKPSVISKSKLSRLEKLLKVVAYYLVITQNWSICG